MKTKGFFPITIVLLGFWFTFHLAICSPALAVSTSVPQTAPAATNQVEESGVSFPATTTPGPSTLLDNEETPQSSSLSTKSLADLQVMIENFTIQAYWRLSILNINKIRLFHDVKIALNHLTTLSGFPGIIEMLGLLASVFVLAALLE
ncbi:MAG TPA: hypothetical protein ENG14_02295 [Thermodesulforhabdus norvegica]|uniref:Uncharacterized protein n=1 Tax=Thermodesulforhabdus norvegica TaxID=39841 RepID=A0A7C1AXS8_9BACT|nr:MAG: hypothetical protein DRH90_18495 [Deltaproteobacteria bacterium]RLC10623.1 MAG: hypothetical protein DRI24_20005 [Deltaproteobacteria bacterium]HDL89716.1 hypothetical protein [Thermodesulforhabdus norvegica]